MFLWLDILKCKHGVSIIVVGFSPKWHHSTGICIKRGIRGAKPKLNYYGYHVNDGKFCSGKCSQLTELLHKGEKRKRKKFICITCGDTSIQLIHKDTDILECENCNG